MRKELLEKLQKVQDEIGRSREVGAQKLEKLSSDTRRAFDSAIESVLYGKNVFAELEQRRKQLGEWKISVFKTIFPVSFKYLLSAPFIYGMFFPVFIMHVGLEIYHQVCFRIYGIPLVNGKDYFVYDRQLLPYLNWFEKLNCIYCSYVNNLFRYCVEIGGRTERFWCPIKYARRVNNTHSQYPKFVDYLDAQNFREKWSELRDFSDININESKDENHEEKECDFVK